MAAASFVVIADRLCAGNFVVPDHRAHSRPDALATARRRALGARVGPTIQPIGRNASGNTEAPARMLCSRRGLPGAVGVCPMPAGHPPADVVQSPRRAGAAYVVGPRAGAPAPRRSLGP